MDDFIEEYQLELVQAKEVPNTSILYPLCQCYEVEIASKITGYHMHFYSFLRNKPIDQFRNEYALEIVLDDMAEHIVDGCFWNYDMWMDEGGGKEYLKASSGVENTEEWTRQYWLYAHHLYTELDKLVGDEGQAELLNI